MPNYRFLFSKTVLFNSVSKIKSRGQASRQTYYEWIQNWKRLMDFFNCYTEPKKNCRSAERLSTTTL